MDRSEKSRDYKLRKRYGITLGQYNEMLEFQDYKCAICGKPASEEKQALAVDHNHETGYIRGLVCKYCNSYLLKYLRDDKSRSIGLMEYLQDAIWYDGEWEE